ncbi:cupin domain-containing protein [Paeniglutamicibacter sp. Y32M11]|jgi:mannose-6-phosphate isomerase-like protein (cupin superfamily)|uniref:cupin domain-containing protein n=1 Tax=Paeniglutamicibacter sp. Y32M11 TaxID=2853258 RepID=UPI001C5299B5|nr:cupin domain-containing protein [Paeniglutamicibacter sp. Y32M11]QXQ10910.1 cupin domain-containing protein [Paeniglutamicibacter sp. Y32M11]
MFEPRGAYTFGHRLHEGSETKMQFHFVDEMKMPVAIQTWEIEPGGYEGMHAHEPHELALEEFYLVLAGSASMHVGDTLHELSIGDSVLASAGVQHDLRNTGDELLRVLVVWGAGGDKDFSRFGSVGKARAARASSAP